MSGLERAYVHGLKATNFLQFNHHSVAILPPEKTSDDVADGEDKPCQSEKKASQSFLRSFLGSRWMGAESATGSAERISCRLSTGKIIRCKRGNLGLACDGRIEKAKAGQLLVNGMPGRMAAAVLRQIWDQHCFGTAALELVELVLGFLRLAVPSAPPVAVATSSEMSPSPSYTFRKDNAVVDSIDDCWISRPGTMEAGCGKEWLLFEFSTAAVCRPMIIHTVGVRTPLHGPLAVKTFHVEVPSHEMAELGLAPDWVSASPDFVMLPQFSAGVAHPMQEFHLPSPLLLYPCCRTPPSASGSYGKIVFRIVFTEKVRTRRSCTTCEPEAEGAALSGSGSCSRKTWKGTGTQALMPLVCGASSLSESSRLPYPLTQLNARRQPAGLIN